MNHFKFLEFAGMLLIPFLVVYIPILIGQRYGIYHGRKTADLQQTPVGTVVGSAFGLLAFILAFTFQIVTNRYDQRKALLLDEVTHIRTTYLRAGLLQEPFSSDTRKLLVEYVDLRIELANDNSKLDFALKRSQEILDKCWNYCETLAEQDRSSEVYSLFTSSVNDLVDDFNQRITVTLEYRIPLVILSTLLIITFFTMLTLGYHFGISGKGGIMINLILALIFSMVFFLIIVLDRPETGLAKLNQKPMITLQNQLHGKTIK